MQTLDSPQNPYVKHLAKLAQDSGYRLDQGRVLLEGKKLISDLLPFINEGTILTTHPFTSTLKTILISEAVSRKLAQTETSEGLYLETSLPQESVLKGCDSLLALDGVSDPGNLGTIMRSALAFEWKGLFLLPGCCDPFNSKVLRASKAALFHLPFQRGTWRELAQIIQREKLTALAADIDGEYPAAVNKPLLVLGSEGRGLSAESKKQCRRISIPIKKEVESLNVAVAGSILMYLLKAPHGLER